MVTASVSAFTLSAVKSLPQKLHVWDPSKNNPLPTLVLPLSPFVYQKGQNTTNLTTLVMQNHQGRDWNVLSSGSHTAFKPQRSRNLMEVQLNNSSQLSQSICRELGVSCSSESVLAPPSPAALFYITNFSDDIPNCQLQGNTLLQIQGMKYWLEMDGKCLLVPEKCLVISKENFLSNPPQNLKIETKILQHRQIGIHTHTLQLRLWIIKVRNKMGLSQSCQK